MADKKMKGVFVTGTDTGIGKTICSALLIKNLRRTKNVCYWKPVQTGIEFDDDTKTVKTLAKCTDEEIFDKGFRLEKPLSPHLSARLANVEITIEKVLNFIETAKKADEKFWIVEGAGGVYVPLNERDLMIDLMKQLKIPVVIIARSGLGTINHTLLTLEAVRNAHLKVSAVIMNGEKNEENRKAVEHYGKVKVFEIFTDTEPDFKNLFAANFDFSF